MSILLALNRQVLHTQDIALAWGIRNLNTLYTTISRYIRAGVLYPIQKGLYATVPLSKLNPYETGIAIAHTYAYVSCETVLAQSGILVQGISAITFVTTYSKMIERAGYHFRFRQLADRHLYQSAGIECRGEVLWASPERAVADMLYFVPSYHFDMHDVINWNMVRLIQKEVGYP